MDSLLISLKALVATFLDDCSIDERCIDSLGYRVNFKDIIPTSCLNKLVAFCVLHDFSYYISVKDKDNLIRFEICR